MAFASGREVSTQPQKTVSGVESSGHLDPQRTCVGCRGKGGRSVLLRIVLSSDGVSLVLDEKKSMPGRGAWIHADQRCFEIAEQRRALTRALRARGQLDASKLRGQCEGYFVDSHNEVSPSGDCDHDRKRV